MSFTEWSNEKKKREKEEQERQIKENGGGETFSDWSDRKQSKNVNQDYINSYIQNAETFFKDAENAFKNIL